MSSMLALAFVVFVIVCLCLIVGAVRRTARNTRPASSLPDRELVWHQGKLVTMGELRGQSRP